MHNFFLHKNILIFRRFFNSANRFHYNDVDNEVLVGSDWVLVNGTESLVNVTVTVTDNQGNTLCRASGVQINYRNSHLTTVYGNFLTAGINKGGIDINTEWSGIYNVWF